MSGERVRLRILAGSFVLLGLGWLSMAVVIFFFLVSFRLLAIHSVVWGLGFLMYASALTRIGGSVVASQTKVRLRDMRSTRILIVFLILGVLIPVVLVLLRVKI